jgi:hypothetical protein
VAHNPFALDSTRASRGPSFAGSGTPSQTSGAPNSFKIIPFIWENLPAEPENAQRTLIDESPRQEIGEDETVAKIKIHDELARNIPHRRKVSSIQWNDKGGSALGIFSGIPAGTRLP